MKPRRGLTGAVAAALPGAALIVFLAPLAGAAAGRAVWSAVCTSSSHPALAARIGHDIRAARRGRVSAVAVGVDDPALGLMCWLNRSEHFDSASVVKVTVLGALLRKGQPRPEPRSGITRLVIRTLPIVGDTRRAKPAVPHTA